MKPIAMRCNQQEYEKIKNVLLENGFREDCWIEREEFGYLINNFNGKYKLSWF